MNHELTEIHVKSFLHFLESDYSDQHSEKLIGFFANEDLESKREAIFDRGKLIFIANGKQVDVQELDSTKDRVVCFDGENINEVNPYAYISEEDVQMKGDTNQRRSGGGFSGGASCNNNNNNNNG